MSTGGAMSSVGHEQRPDPTPNNYNDAPRLQGGKRNAHDPHDTEDTRGLGQRAEASEILEKQKDEEAASKTVTDPLEPARSHGNEPSRGAKIDAKIQAEEEEELRRKGKI